MRSVGSWIFRLWPVLIINTQDISVFAASIVTILVSVCLFCILQLYGRTIINRWRCLLKLKVQTELVLDWYFQRKSLHSFPFFLPLLASPALLHYTGLCFCYGCDPSVSFSPINTSGDIFKSEQVNNKATVWYQDTDNNNIKKKMFKKISSLLTAGNLSISTLKNISTLDSSCSSSSPRISTLDRGCDAPWYRKMVLILF